MKKLLPSTFSWILAGIGLTFGAAPSLAQEPEEIIVTGRFGKVPNDVKSLTQTVSYADLNLGTDAGWRELRRRVRLTAAFLCDKLGEPIAAQPPGPSCRSAATKDAMDRVGTLKETAAPRDTTWVAPSAWQPPYPRTGSSYTQIRNIPRAAL